MRWTSNIVAAVSAVLFVTASTLGVISIVSPEKPIVAISRGDAFAGVKHSVYIWNGCVSFQREWGDQFYSPQSKNHEMIDREDAGWDGWGAGYHNLTRLTKEDGVFKQGNRGHWKEFWFSFWWPATRSFPLTVFLTGVIARWFVERSSARDGRTSGRCPTCGYDLRVTPHRRPSTVMPVRSTRSCLAVSVSQSARRMISRCGMLLARVDHRPRFAGEAG